MCCRRGRRNQPLLIALGTEAYTAYQNRQAKRATEQKVLSPAPAEGYNPEQTLNSAMRSVNLEEQNADIPPPDYDDVIVHRTKVDSLGRDLIVDDRDFGREKDVDLSDSDDTFRELDGQQRELQPDASPPWFEGTGSWRERKAAWKAEKKMRKAEWKAERRARWAAWKDEREMRRAARRC